MDTLLLGLTLGLGAGFAPGPLLVLVVDAALRRGFAAGARVAAAPLLSDAPIIALCVLVLRELPEDVLAGLSLAGALVVARLASDVLRDDGAEPSSGARDLRRAVLVNALSPHPWLFWITVGGPLLVDAGDRSAALAVAFLAGVYATLVGAKVVLAAVTARIGRAPAVQRSGAVRWGSAGLLAAAAVLLLVDAVARLG